MSGARKPSAARAWSRHMASLPAPDCPHNATRARCPFCAGERTTHGRFAIVHGSAEKRAPWGGVYGFSRWPVLELVVESGEPLEALVEAEYRGHERA